MGYVRQLSGEEPTPERAIFDRAATRGICAGDAQAVVDALHWIQKANSSWTNPRRGETLPGRHVVDQLYVNVLGALLGSYDKNRGSEHLLTEVLPAIEDALIQSGEDEKVVLATMWHVRHSLGDWETRIESGRRLKEWEITEKKARIAQAWSAYWGGLFVASTFALAATWAHILWADKSEDT